MAYRFNFRRLGLQFGLFYGCFTLDASRLGSRLSLSLGLTRALNSGAVCLQLEQLLSRAFSFSLVGDLLSLESTFGLLLQSLSFVPANENEHFSASQRPASNAQMNACSTRFESQYNTVQGYEGFEGDPEQSGK
jgi:hypothetical protein